MSSKAMFIIAVLGIAIAALFYRFGSIRNMIGFFKTKDGRKVLAGIVIFVGLSLLTVTVFAESKYFAYGEVSVGLDRTFNQSPQCKPSKNTDRLTSHGGVKINLVQSSDQRFELNTRYTHHSCAFGSDRNTYDAFGLEATYKLWGR